ncbi:MAG: AAA family ATPase, partial [Promethearchaeota archaeon]
FFNECFLRICPNAECGALILKPNKKKDADLSENPILNSKVYDELKLWQDIYYMSYNEALNSKEHPFSKLSEQNKQTFKQTLIDIKNEHFVCPHCKKKGIKTFILKQKLLFIDSMLSKILLSIDTNQPWIIFGYPGDGKSEICLQFLQYLEWRYGVGYEIFNVDENTTIAKLGGGFSPLSFGGDKVIRYGVITKCNLKKGKMSADGELIGWGKNICLDELNRGEAENYAFLMGFFAAPYRYLIEEEGRVIENPNRRADLYGVRWQFCATMNIQDVGNQPLPLALKRRFFIIRSDYETEQVEEIIDGVIKLSSYEKDILESLMRAISGWHSHNEIRFPAGIGHYTKFFKSLRSGLQNMDEDLNNKFTKQKLESFIEDILIATIIMPIIDENRRKVVEGKLKAVKNLASDAFKNIEEHYNDNGKDLESLETIIYY